MALGEQSVMLSMVLIRTGLYSLLQITIFRALLATRSKLDLSNLECTELF